MAHGDILCSKFFNTFIRLENFFLNYDVPLLIDSSVSEKLIILFVWASTKDH